MSLLEHQNDHRECLRMASELLGAPAVAVDLSWSMELRLRRHLQLEARRGIGSESALLNISDDRAGHRLAIGVERFRIRMPGNPIRVVHVVAPRSFRRMDSVYEFWAVAKGQLRQFYGFLRRAAKVAQKNVAPIMSESDRTRLWDHTIEFLRHGCEALREFGVAQKRGVLLLGEPGNGKTMACRWLRSQCHRYGLEWRSVTAEEYERKRNDAEAHELFELGRPGIVCFDDMDIALRDRSKFGETRDHSTFLGALDGLDMRQGIVFIFTSNALLEDLDPAFCRPGRIDLVLSFLKPDLSLRRALITQTWHPEILRHVRLDAVLRSTEGLSFAEIDEVKRLIVLNYLKSGEWNWECAWNAFRSSRDNRQSKGKLGFGRDREDTHELAESERSEYSS
jgi:cell division protease FtsH